MSIDPNVSDIDNQTSGPVETPKIDNTVSYDSHRKLLGEKKAVSAELNELRDWKAKLEQDKLQANGKQDEVISALRAELTETKTNHAATTKKVAFDKFSNQVALAAKEIGCVDTNTLVDLLTKEQMASVQIDDRLNANGDDLKRLVSELKESRPYMFGASTINHTPVTMAGFKKEETKTIATMTKEEMIAMARLL